MLLPYRGRFVVTTETLGRRSFKHSSIKVFRIKLKYIYKILPSPICFERLCMALQGKTSNYDTDVFTPLIGKIAQLSGKRYGDDPKVDVLFPRQNAGRYVSPNKVRKGPYRPSPRSYRACYRLLYDRQAELFTANVIDCRIACLL